MTKQNLELRKRCNQSSLGMLPMAMLVASGKRSLALLVMGSVSKSCQIAHKLLQSSLTKDSVVGSVKLFQGCGLHVEPFHPIARPTENEWGTIGSRALKADSKSLPKKSP